MCVSFSYLEALPKSFVMVSRSQGLASLHQVESGFVYLVLMEPRWASHDSLLLLTESGPLCLPARQSSADDLRLGEKAFVFFDAFSLGGKRWLTSHYDKAICIVCVI